MDNKKFGNFIRQLRTEKKLTQKELGEKLNITDKAISKWERGLSFPDIAMLNLLSNFFKVDISELLNGERGVKEKIDVEALIQKAIEKYKDIEGKRKAKIKKIKKVMGFSTLVICIIFILIQAMYFMLLTNHNYEYVIDILLYLINEVIIISGVLSITCLINKLSNKTKVITYVLCLIATILNVAFMINQGMDNKCIVSFSKDFSNELILKVNKNSGAVELYKNAKLFIFAKPKEQLSYASDGKIKKQWLTSDICSITYKDKEGILREYVSTYGDRGNRISFYNVAPALEGSWKEETPTGSTTTLLADNKGITITKDQKEDLFEYSNCKQFGTIALVLYKNDVPQYVVALNKDCQIDNQTNIIKKGGTITLAEISMDKTISKSLYCTTYKSADDMSNYNVVNVGENDYKIQNGIMYISFDGEKTIEVPGDFSNMANEYTDYNYQISKEKTVFYYSKNGKKFLVYSDDMGENWNTVEIESKPYIQNIHFVNSKVGFMLKFDDVAMGIAFGRISKTNDGGQSWNDVFYGIGDNEKIFKRSSEIKFIDENTGFLTMPMSGTDNSSELYITKDGGFSFSKIDILQSDIYDYYNLPTIENKKLLLKITQGADGDYNGGDFKEFYSTDMGANWIESKEV